MNSAKTGLPLFRCSALLAMFLVASSRADAAYIVLDGNVPQTDENVLLSNDEVGTTIQGSLNQSGAVVNFTSPSQFLAGPSSGQARVEALSANDINAPAVDVDDSIIVSLDDTNLRFGSLIFNAFAGTGSLTIVINGVNADNTPANATISLDDDANPLGLSNGSNFYTVLASGGMLMTSVEIQPNANSSYTDLRQIRIGGIVPEPAGMLLVAHAVLLLAVSRRRRGR